MNGTTSVTTPGSAVPLARLSALVPGFAALDAALALREPAWLTDLRRTAAVAFDAKGLPSHRDEDFRYSSLKPLASLAFALAPTGFDEAAVRAAVASAALPASAVAARVVLVNGRLWPGESTLGSVEAEGLAVQVRTLVDAISDEALGLHRLLGAAGPGLSGPIGALATALLADGLVIHAPPRSELSNAIEIIHVTAPDALHPFVTAPRVFVLAGEGAQLRVVESFVSIGGGTTVGALTLPVTQVTVATGANVDHSRHTNEAAGMTHVGIVSVSVADRSNFTSNSVAVGGGFMRCDAHLHVGERAECFLNGLYFIDGDAHCDHHTTVDHLKPFSHSNEMYKGVLRGAATGVFNGRIFVRPDAQKTNAFQSNRSLVLSDAATMNTKPQLEIWADDVKCSHGATVGQLDDDSLFYLRARGVPLDEANVLLTQAFAQEVTDRFSFTPFRERVQTELFGELARVPDLD